MAGGHTGWLVGGGVLLVGVVAAMPFYRGHEQRPQDGAAPTESEVPWSGDPLTLRVGAQPPVRSSTTPLPMTSSPVVAAPLQERPPRVEGEYGELFKRFRPAKPPQEISSDPSVRALSISARSPSGENRDRREHSAPIAQSSAPTARHEVLRPTARDRFEPGEEPPREKKHSIVDGDTLERIALRYLGDAFYASAIFERNREVLSDPQLLPVGEQIVIPDPRELTVSATLPLEPLDAPADQAQPQTQLEPLPE